MEDPLLKTDHLAPLMDPVIFADINNILNKWAEADINDILNKWEEIVRAELREFGLSDDLRSNDAEERLVGFRADEQVVTTKKGERKIRKIKGKRKIRENETIATKYITLQNISWIRASISGGQLLAAILFSLRAGVTLMVADYVSGGSARESGQAAADVKAAAGFAFYKPLLQRDEELKKESYGRYAYGRAQQLEIELAGKGITVTLDAIKKGLANARKKLNAQKDDE